MKAAASDVQVPVRIFNQWIAGRPTAVPGRKGTGWMQLLLAWGGVGLISGVVTALIGPGDSEWWHPILWLPAGYLTGVFAGYGIQGPPSAWRAKPSSEDRQEGRIAWNLVELTVDSYVFVDASGTQVEAEVMFAARPPAWPARLEPSTFHFAENETYRDVVLTVEAPNSGGAPEVFNVSARQGGAPTGGVTVAVTPGTEP